MNSEIKIFIADDHPIMRQGLSALIAQETGLSVSGEASDGETALNSITENEYDIAVIDVEMPRMSGIEIARQLKKKALKTKLIFLTMHNDEDLFNEAMDLGIYGYVLKENAVQDIIKCIKEIASGGYYISPLISKYLINRELRYKNLADETPTINSLTKTERVILKLIADQKTSKQIADELNVSYKTIENHRGNISKKLKLKGSHSLIKFAIDNKNLI